ncbi:MAG: hypothetical protein KA791_13270 [Flavobacteriales bacterium]|nr:hypothetical protein [Flavobacteriales bacterium]
MSATFNVETTFIIQSRSVLVFVGDILRGEVRKGMKLLIPLNLHTSMHVIVDAVEFIDPAGKVGLCMKYKDQAELQLIQALNIGNEELELID